MQLGCGGGLDFASMASQLLGVALRARRDTTQVMLGVSLRAFWDTTLVIAIFVKNNIFRHNFLFTRVEANVKIRRSRFGLWATL